MNGVMNRNQVIAIGLAVTAALLAFNFPPYYDDSGLIGGTVYFPFRPPRSEPYIFLNKSLLSWEFSFVGVSLRATLTAFRSGARRRQKVCLLSGMGIEIVFLVGSLPSFPIVLVPEFTWLVLNILAVLLFGLVLLLGRGHDSVGTTEL